MLNDDLHEVVGDTFRQTNQNENFSPSLERDANFNYDTFKKEPRNNSSSQLPKQMPVFSSNQKQGYNGPTGKEMMRSINK